MELFARLNGPPQLTGKGLIVLCSYRGGVARRTPWSAGNWVGGTVIDRLAFRGLRQFIAANRDHFANPRDLAYQLCLAEAVLARAHFTSFDLLVDAPLSDEGSVVSLAGAANVHVQKVSRQALGSRGHYDTIVLVYPDALGLSWSGFEAHALGAAKQVVFVNGRRRLFTLDRTVRRGLLWRRFLASSRIAELLMAVAVVPLAAGLAAVDWMHGRT